MSHNTIIQIILYALVLTISYLGVREDIKKRTFSNNKIGIIIMIGIVNIFFAERVGIALLMFVGFNIMGVFLSSLRILSAADWKLFSAYSLFIPFEDVKLSIIFVIALIIFSILLKIHYIKEGKYKEAFLDEWKCLQTIIYSKQIMMSNKLGEVYKTESIPATVSITLSFFITVLFII